VFDVNDLLTFQPYAYEEKDHLTTPLYTPETHPKILPLKNYYN
jgi:hypothetical protein